MELVERTTSVSENASVRKVEQGRRSVHRTVCFCETDTLARTLYTLHYDIYSDH
jgi:hypothetical protein